MPPASFFDVDTVQVTATLDLLQASKHFSVDPALLKVLNPMYKLGIVPAPRDGKMYPLVLPRAAVASFMECADSAYAGSQPNRAIADEVTAAPTASAPAAAETTLRYHKVRSGETLSSIAKKYGSKVSDIQRWNRLRSTTIQIGQRLIVKK
jgi:membrane-bound lytic murein transglycosylase D